MTINIEELINSLGKPYEDIFNNGLIPYKTKPSGFSGDDVISLDMKKEGVYLSFYRENKLLKEITLELIDDKSKYLIFPNYLPFGSKESMNRQWVHQLFGQPIKAYPPEIIMKKQYGWTEFYLLSDYHISLSMKVDYNLSDLVVSVTFLSVSEVSL